MMKTNYKRLFVLLLVALTSLSMISFATWASVAANFTVDNSVGNSDVGPSDTDHEVLEVDLPDTAGSDTLLLNGAGYTVADGDSLTTFGATFYYSDSGHDASDYAGSELIVNDANTDGIITSGEVVTPGTAELLSNWTTGQNIKYQDSSNDGSNYAGTELVVDSADGNVTAGEIVNDGTADLIAFGSTEPDLDIYLDHGTNNNLYTDGEDIFYQEHNGSDTYSTGDTMQAFSANELSFYDDQANLNTAYDDGEAIITDGDSDGFPSSGDTVVTAGAATVEALTATDSVCFDGSVSDDVEFDATEVIWWDAGGDCSAFTTATDVILVGGVAPSGTSREFGTEQEVAFLDDDNDGAYTCTRAGTCEPIVHYGANTDFSDDDDLPTTTIFFDSSTEGTDGIATTGTGWDESGAAEDLIDFAAASATYGYISAGAYVDGDDIFGLEHNGATTVFSDGDESRLFLATEKFSDANNNTWIDSGELIANDTANAGVLSGSEIVTAGAVDLLTFGGNFKYSDDDNDTLLTGGELIADSADLILAGAEIVYPGVVDIQAFPANIMYHDGSTNAAYTDGEDVVDDADASTYYNADQLTSIQIGSPGTCVDGDLAGIKIYEDDGDDVFDAGDTLIGSDTTSPFIGQTITTNTTANGTAISSVYTSAGNERTIFATIDTVASPTHGCTFQGRIPQNGVVLLSTNDGPTDTFVGTSNVVTVDAQVTITDANISITSSGTGTAGTEQYIIGDTLTVYWDDSVATGDANTDITSVTVDFLAFGGGAAVAMRDDGAGCDLADGGTNDKWCAEITIGAGAVDSNVANNLNVTVTAIDDQSNNSGAVADTTGLDCDNIAPAITDNGTLTITTDGGVIGTAAVNGGGVVPDQVTQSAVTFASADGDSTTIDLTALTGEAALTITTESNDVIAGALDTSQTFIMTATDNAGNTSAPTVSDAISVDNILPLVTAPNVTVTGCSGTGGACINGDTPSLDWLGDTDGETDTIASATFDGSDLRTGDTALAAADPGTPGTNNWSVGLSGAMDTQDDAGNTIDVTVVDNGGNSVSATSAVGYVADTNVPIVTGANITVTGCTGTAGACINGDTPTLNWLGDTDGETDTIASATFDGSSLRAVDAALLAGDPGTPGTNDWNVVLTGAMDAQDDLANTIDVTVVDDAGNSSGAVTSAVGYVVDTNVPSITDNGTLTITTDGGTAGLCEIGDKVTQSAVTVAAADGDTATINLLAPNDLTGEAALAAATESGAAIANGLNNGAMTFDITATDDAGNISIVAASDPIAVYTIAPGTLASTGVTLSNSQISASSTYTFDFTTVAAWPVDGKFQVTFPAGFGLAGLNGQTATGLTNVDGVITAAVVGQVVTFTRDGSGAITAGGTAVSFTIATGTNGPTAGTTGTFDFKMQQNSGAVLDEDTAVAGVTLTSPPAASGGGGGGGGSYSSSDSTSNTTTADPKEIDETIDADRTFSSPIEVDGSMIATDPATGDQTVVLTGDAEVTLQPNRNSTISAIIPPNTSVTGSSDWDGIIEPPLVRSTTVISPNGAPIEGVDNDLIREDVDVMVRVGSASSPLELSNPATIAIPTDLADGTMVRVLFSPDGDTWENFGVFEVVDGYVTFETTHFSYFAISESLAANIEEGAEKEVVLGDRLFIDTEGHWAEAIIDKVAEKGIVNGKSEGIFEPNSNITRAELTKIAVFAFGYTLPAAVTEESFGDVDTGAWYAAVVQVAKENNLVEGYEGNIFKPNDYISRAAALKILLEAAGYDTVGMIMVEFSDTAADAWYMKYVNFAKLNDIVGGYEDGTFRPGNYITRAEVAKVVLFILELDPEKVVYPEALDEEEAVEEEPVVEEEEEPVVEEEEIGVDTGNGYWDVTAEEAKTLVDTMPPDLVIIDVATDYENQHIPGALGYYVGDGSLDDAIPTLDDTKTYLVYCRAASASMEGAQKLADAGLTVYRLDGDFAAWVDAGYEVAMCYETVETSAEATDHVHGWCEDWVSTAEYCEEEVCHDHVVDLDMNLAEEGGEVLHTHVLEEVVTE